MANPRAETSTETRVIEGEAAHAREMIRKTGEMVRPPGTEYAGSVVVHYYKDTMSIKPTFRTQIFTMLGTVEEGFADYGWKQLREAMRAAYGRVAEKRRSM
jgi:hypothetical protein